MFAEKNQENYLCRITNTRGRQNNTDIRILSTFDLSVYYTVEKRNRYLTYLYLLRRKLLYSNNRLQYYEINRYDYIYSDKINCSLWLTRIDNEDSDLKIDLIKILFISLQNDRMFSLFLSPPPEDLSELNAFDEDNTVKHIMFISRSGIYTKTVRYLSCVCVFFVIRWMHSDGND